VKFEAERQRALIDLADMTMARMFDESLGRGAVRNPPPQK